jgi:hypothetical protein
MTNQGVNFHLPPGGQVSVAVDTGAVARKADRLDIVVHAPTTSAARRPGMAGGGASTRWADC